MFNIQGRFGRRSVLTLSLSFAVIGACWGEPSVANAESKLLRHVVIFKFKDSSTADDVKTIVNAFRELPSKIDVIAGFEWGTDVSPEMKSDGFTHCFFITFASEKDRDAYLPHPAHQAFVSVVKPHVDKVLVVDYWTQK